MPSFSSSYSAGFNIPESVAFGYRAVFFYSVLSCLIANSNNMCCQFVSFLFKPFLHVNWGWKNMFR